MPRGANYVDYSIKRAAGGRNVESTSVAKLHVTTNALSLDQSRICGRNDGGRGLPGRGCRARAPELLLVNAPAGRLIRCSLFRGYSSMLGLTRRGFASCGTTGDFWAGLDLSVRDMTNLFYTILTLLYYVACTALLLVVCRSGTTAAAEEHTTFMMQRRRGERREAPTAPNSAFHK